MVFCESAYRIYMSDLMKSKKVSQLLYVDIFVPFNICIFALRWVLLINSLPSITEMRGY